MSTRVSSDVRGEFLLATPDQLGLLDDVTDFVAAQYGGRVAMTFLRTSSPFIGDLSPIEVIVQKEPAEAHRLAAEAVTGLFGSDLAHSSNN